jgi:AcrR family transcriptional regulator
MSADKAPQRRAEAREASGDKLRDAERSRESILSASESLFAEHGFDGVSLGQIAAAAGLSRGTPSYFFGSKAELYEAVLARAFERREESTRRACQPLLTWAAADGGDPIQAPLAQAVAGYLDFLAAHPAFLKLIQREELAGASRLRQVPRASKAIEETFAAVRAVATERGLREFDVKQAVLVFVSLTFFPLAQSSTFMTSLGVDLGKPRARRRHAELVTDQLLGLLGVPGSGGSGAG